MSKLLDGKKLSENLLHALSEEIKDLMAQNNVRAPKLAIFLTTTDFASQKYVELKKLKGEKIGIDVDLYDVSEESSVIIMEKMTSVIQDPAVDGVMVQLPLRSDLLENAFLPMIPVEKDVDGLSPVSLGMLFHGDSSVFMSATPRGVIRLLDYYEVDIDRKTVVLIGWNKFIGMPLEAELINRGATVSILHSKTEDLKDFTKQADILISATGQCCLIQEDFIKEGCVVIDVGFSKDEDGKICGDVDFDSVVSKASYITPVPGGVGPMTVYALLENTVKAWKKQTLE